MTTAIITIEVKVRRCSDDDSWVWMLTDEYGGIRCDGYADTEAEALEAARRAYAEEVARLHGE